MKIDFLTQSPNDKTGSYRIWVRDLCRTFTELGQNSEIHLSLDSLTENTDVLLLCKSAYKLAQFVKKKHPKIKVGAINIPNNYLDKSIDFVIVGSLEEYVSMSSYRDVFIVPLIERKFENAKIKVHKQESKLRIGFHGHYPHLFKFAPFIKSAIEEINKTIETEVVVITGHPGFDWKDGRPNVNVEMHDYDGNFEKVIKTCDIGIVPNVSDVRMFVKGVENITSVDHGLYETDYFIRMKNKTNAGRSYVFYQLGVPVIHDLSPSSFELLSKTGYNFCGHDKLSYYREIKKLTDHNLRNEVARANKNVFDKYYDPKVHASELIKKIEGVVNE